MFNFLFTHSPLLYLIQPFWRDEAFSVLFASKPIAWIVTHSSFETPLYYILLHFWMRLFGTSEIAARGFSVVGFTLATVVCIYLAEHLFNKHWLSWFIPLLFVTNPMLLYYAFETRTYGWFMFFAMLTIYGYLKGNWKIFVIGSIFGFYTHLYMAFVPFVCSLHYLLFHWKSLLYPKIQWSNPFVRSVFWILGGVTIWLIRFMFVIKQFGTTWYYPVDLHLAKSILGNMFTGYEGTPWYLWSYTANLSIAIFILTIISLIPKNTRKTALFFSLLVYIPLILIFLVSLVKPLFVNRYFLPVTIAELFSIGYAVYALKPKFLRVILASSVLLFSLWFNVWYPTEHMKTDYRTSVREINMLLGPKDVVYADDAVHYFETLYYAKDKTRVFFYTPTGGTFPWYVGDMLLEPSHIVTQLPTYPTRAFIIHRDTTYSVSYTLPILGAKKK